MLSVFELGETHVTITRVGIAADKPAILSSSHAELYNYYDFIRETRGDDFQVLSAGQMKHFLFGYLIGSPAYLCPLTPFAPQVGMDFYDALQRNDIAAPEA